MRGVVHGDLSEFNIRLAPGGPMIIDLPQAVDAQRGARRVEGVELDGALVDDGPVGGLPRSGFSGWPSPGR